MWFGGFCRSLGYNGAYFRVLFSVFSGVWVIVKMLRNLISVWGVWRVLEMCVLSFYGL